MTRNQFEQVFRQCRYFLRDWRQTGSFPELTKKLEWCLCYRVVTDSIKTKVDKAQ